MNEEQEPVEKGPEHYLQELFDQPARPVAEIRKALIDRTQKGGITLIVGAGISIPRGVPNWDDLAKAMWKTAFGEKTKSPWAGSKTSPHGLPQFLPIVLELVYRKLGPDAFARALRKTLYSKHVKYPRDDEKCESSSESLAVLGRLLLQEFKRKQERRIDAVITLNADELLEQAAMTLVNRKRKKKAFPVYPFRVVGMSTHMDLGQDMLRCIPIYHIHGFIPQRPNLFDLSYMLVFTDLQYWSTSASALTFANRIVSWALNESCCIFIGLSMTDINVLRWLALRTLEFEHDVVQGAERSSSVSNILHSFQRHYWIRPASSDPTGFLSWFMRLRGIEAVDIGAWRGKSFQNLIQKCFPE